MQYLRNAKVGNEQIKNKLIFKKNCLKATFLAKNTPK
jgi:hypothetical protein